MKKSSTIIERTCHQVAGFQGLYQRMDWSITISGKRQSTLTNYARCLAHMASHFKTNPLQLDEEQVWTIFIRNASSAHGSEAT